MYKRSIVRFRQDLRVEDQTALYEASRLSKEVIPIFVLDETLLAKCPEHDARLGFLCDALKQLDNQLQMLNSKLHVAVWNPTEVIPHLVKTHQCDAVFVNRSYGEGSQTRDKKIEQRSRSHGLSFQYCDDFLLVQPYEMQPRKVFTPFFKAWTQQIAQSSLPVHTVKHLSTPSIPILSISKIFQHISFGSSIWTPDFWRKRLHDFAFVQYDQTRNIPAIDGTSKLSPYLRFGLISPRILYKTILNSSSVYASELARREFWNHIAYHFPQAIPFEFQEKRRKIHRQNNAKRFHARQNGQTGYPIVDAWMRQLKAENRMHNRVRMIVASFLTKDLLIDRRRWEQHFASYLLDYDRNVNVGNRQRSASVGADPKPIRIFSPILQSQRFDPQAEYIKHRVPELANAPLDPIHDPLSYPLDYVEPIVDHRIQRKIALEIYANKL